MKGLRDSFFFTEVYLDGKFCVITILIFRKSLNLKFNCKYLIRNIY